LTVEGKRRRKSSWPHSKDKTRESHLVLPCHLGFYKIKALFGSMDFNGFCELR
jgi:hypothetical protein